ncbi:MAG TPA: TadE family type IV pilus minor pilin [Nocardioidaceae bacterium]|nr:TadE family type IV pilus minor pilin [Nocardioidaceae bacterium]
MHKTSGWPPCRRRSPSGSVTAEMAVLLPTLVLVAGALAWLVGVGVAQVACVDAARDAARALARAEPEQVATELALRSAPDGARVHLRRADGMVEVEVTYRATPPGGLLDAAAALDLRATASTPVEVDDAPVP